MKTKSARESAKTKAKAKAQQPYSDAKRPRKRTSKPQQPRTSPSASSTASSLGSSSLPPNPGARTGAVLFRQLCIEQVRETHPDIRPRNDYDLLELASHHYKGTPAEIYAALDEEFAQDVGADGYEFTLDACRMTLDRYIEPTGMKPKESAPDSKYVFVRPIPDSKYSLRLYPGSISAAEYCLDFVETATGKPVNSPFKYELWGIPNPDDDTPWFTIPMCGKLRTIERGFGIKQADIEPGAEKFVLRDGQTCVLMRPGKRSLRFTVPVRKMQRSAAVDDMDVVDLPRYIEPEL